MNPQCKAPASNPGAPTKIPNEIAATESKPDGLQMESTGRCRHCWTDEGERVPGACRHCGSAGLARVVLSVLLLLGAVACDPAAGRYLAHLGDSNGALLGEYLEQTASWRSRGDVILRLPPIPGYTLGYHLPYWTQRLSSTFAGGRAGIPDWVLIQLGTNDMAPFPGCDFDPAKPPCYESIDTDQELDAAIDALLGAVPIGSRMLWVEPAPVVEISRRERFRGALVRAQLRWPLEILHIPEELLYEPGFGIPSEIRPTYEPDGVHIALEMRTFVARVIIRELDRLDGRP